MNKVLIFGVFSFFVVSTSFAQLATSSPYSRFGLGDLKGVSLSKYSSLGGGVTSLKEPYNINPNNPATYTAFGSNTFLLSTGVMHKTTNMQNVIENQITNNTAFSHLVIGFPINNKIGASIGVLPYSNIGYELNAIADSYNADLIYSGDGGINEIYFGTAYQLLDEVSVGLNAVYLFGGLNRWKRLVFTDDDFFLNSLAHSRMNLQGYYYELGILYEKEINQEKNITFGITANNTSDIRAKSKNYLETFEYLNSVESTVDVVLDTTEWGYATLPRYLAAGFSYRDSEKWLFVVDYNIQDWASYRLFEESDSLENSMSISAGVQYIPEYNSVTKYYKKIQYRLGLSYRNTPIQIRNTQIQEKSISFGVGFPVNRSRTQYDFSLIIGERGTVEYNLIKEQFLSFGLTISYDGIWFVKRKYD